MDRINASSSLPSIHAMRAYAQTSKINKPLGSPGVTAPPAVTPAAPSGSTGSTTQTAPIGRIGQVGAPAGPQPTSDPSRLVAAKVDPINLARDVATVAGPKPMITSAGTYSMHPSSAARNTAATGVALGRGLDLKG
ncbi:MAG: hypothetical protein AB8C13_05685 [Phycisphaerales bacterium]